MISLRLVDCVECNSIPSLLEDIDCKLTEMANNQYNNIVYELNRQIDSISILDLLNYKRILTHKYCNPNYACPFTIQMIANKVKLLIHK